MGRRSKVYAVILLLAVFFSILTFPDMGNAFSGGLTQSDQDADGNEVDVVQRGCFCHGPGGDLNVTLAASQADQGNVTLSVSGVPFKYTGNRTYELTVEVASQSPAPDRSPDAHKGGFLMFAYLGDLSAVENDLSVQVNSLGLATHTTEGNKQRQWKVLWTAPPGGSGDVVFMVAGNAVDGDNINSEGDRWNTMTFNVWNSSTLGPEEDFRTYSVGPATAEEPGEPEEELGFFLRAYWIGLLGIGAMVLVIGISYYVIKSTTRFHKDESEHKRRRLP